MNNNLCSIILVSQYSPDNVLFERTKYVENFILYFAKVSTVLESTLSLIKGTLYKFASITAAILTKKFLKYNIQKLSPSNPFILLYRNKSFRTNSPFQSAQ